MEDIGIKQWLVGILLIVSFGYLAGWVVDVVDEASQVSWKSVKHKNTIEAYESFMEKHPNSEFIHDAKLRLEPLYFQRAKDVNTIAAYESFLYLHPDSEFTNETKLKLESLYFQKTKDADTIEAYKNFLETYPNSKFINEIEEAELRLEGFSYQKTKDIGTISSYEEFLKSYPKSVYANEVESNLIKLKEQIGRIEKAVIDALSADSILFDVYTISRYPKKVDFLISIHLREWSFPGDNSPYVRENYATKKSLERTARYRCAKIIKSIFLDPNIPDAGEIIIKVKHGVRTPDPILGSFLPPRSQLGIGIDTVMTIYQVSISFEYAKKYDWSTISLEDIMRIYSVDQEIPSNLEIVPEFRKF